MNQKKLSPVGLDDMVQSAIIPQLADWLGASMGIYRDYPVSKGCTSPFAPIWIAEMVRRQA